MATVGNLHLVFYLMAITNRQYEILETINTPANLYEIFLYITITSMVIVQTFVNILGKFNVVGICTKRNYAQKWIAKLCNFNLHEGKSNSKGNFLFSLFYRRYTRLNILSFLM